MKLLFYIVCFLSCISLYAQQLVQVQINIKDTEGNIVPFGSVQLKDSQTDQLLYFSEIADGVAVLKEVVVQTYTLEIAAPGLQKYTSQVQLDQHMTLNITLKQDVKQLDAVTVTSAKNNMYVKDGVITVEVADTNLETLTEPTEVLAKLPGVIVSADKESVDLVGKGNPLLYLGNQRITLEQLKSIPVNSIAKIELLRFPSAKYEADGRAVILVTLKSNKDEGYQVKIRENAALNHFFNNYLNANSYIGLGKLTMQLGLGYQQLQHWESNTSTFSYPAGNFKNQYVTRSNGDRLRIPGAVGATYNFNDTDYISTQTNFTIHRDDMPITTQSYITDNGEVTYYNNYSGSTGNRDYITSNINAFKKLGAKTELFGGIQYTDSQRKNTYTIQDITAPENPELLEVNHQETKSKAFAARTDLTVRFTDKFNWESGLNWYQANTRATSGNQVIENPAYDYKEQTAAAYTQVQGSWGAVFYTAGARFEHNDRKGIYPETGEEVLRINKAYVFPKINLNVEVDSLNSFSANYGRSIARPGFSQANNITVFINKYMEFANNINLQSSLNDELSLSYTHNKMALYFTYYRSTNPVYYVTNYNAENDRYRTQPVNMEKENGYQLVLLVPFTYKVWTSTNYIYGGLVDGRDSTVKHLGATPYGYFYTNNEIRLKKDLNLGVNFFYMLAHEEGIRSSRGFNALGFTASKKFNEHWTLGLVANDVFGTLNFTQEYNSNGIQNKTTYFGDNRSVEVSIAYTFGHLVKPEYKNKEVDKELDRVN